MSDVRGTGSAVVTTTVVGLQGRHVSATMPLTGQVLMFDGTQWIPGTVSGPTPPPTSGTPPVTGGGGAPETGGGGAPVTGGGTGAAAPPVTGTHPVTGGGGAPVVGGGGAPETGGGTGAAALLEQIAELEARIAALEEK